MIMKHQLTVLFEDNHILAVEKPPGMLTQGDRTGDLCMVDQAKAYLKEKYHKPGDVYLGLVHRLDRPTGGVLLLARTSKAAKRLSEQFRRRTVQKFYLAACRGVPERARGECTHYLRFDSERRKSMVSKRPKEGFQEAVLRYSLLDVRAGDSLLEVQLLTGRKHQIRAQLSALGLPILRDRKYTPGDRGRGVVKEFGLWAHRLSCDHPVAKGRLEICSVPSPTRHPLWSEFAESLSSLPAG